MNIRKFTGATSRDALRLVREALGGDAVVLSNRTLEDGSVEIVALADAELAAIAPKAAPARAQRGLPAAEAPPRLSANPYAAGGLPDVFSSVFGASAETDAGFDADLDDEADADTEARHEAGHGDAAAAGFNGLADSAVAAEGASTPAPWLVEHARRLTRQQDALAATPPAAAVATPGSPGSLAMPAPAAAPVRDMAEPPAWAEDIVRQVAARRMPAAEPAAREMPEPREMRDLHVLRDAREARDARPAPAVPRTPAAQPRSAGTGATLADELDTRIARIVNETVMSELSAIRGMMEEQFAGLVWGERQRRSPLHGALTKRLFAAGFSAQLVRNIVDNLPTDLAAGSLEAALDWTESVLAGNLPVLDSEDALMERGGVFALMGPTGVGKTTTTAKLAARCVMRFGASKVALLTTDSYRIGGHEQLRIFGRILGVSVHAVKDGGDLQLALSELRNKHIVLIDTIGMSQRDRTVSDQIAMLQGADTPVQRLLLLAATSHGDTLNEVVQAYRGDGRPDLAGCILTKLDEATNLGCPGYFQMSASWPSSNVRFYRV
ncbi:MAG: Flagellar biosynthesis protein FlhF [Burkholderia plantarii]|nr:MAG: Flagellar biosynthesis protein FlhF [Burkholderia plantarii]